MKQMIKKPERLAGGCVPSVIFPPSPAYFEAIKAAREALRASGKLLFDKMAAGTIETGELSTNPPVIATEEGDESYALRFARTNTKRI